MTVESAAKMGAVAGGVTGFAKDLGKAAFEAAFPGLSGLNELITKNFMSSIDREQKSDFDAASAKASGGSVNISTQVMEDKLDLIHIELKEMRLQHEKTNNLLENLVSRGEGGGSSSGGSLGDAAVGAAEGAATATLLAGGGAVLRGLLMNPVVLGVTATAAAASLAYMNRDKLKEFYHWIWNDDLKAGEKEEKQFRKNFGQGDIFSFLRKDNLAPVLFKEVPNIVTPYHPLGAEDERTMKKYNSIHHGYYKDNWRGPYDIGGSYLPSAGPHEHEGPMWKRMNFENDDEGFSTVHAGLHSILGNSNRKKNSLFQYANYSGENGNDPQYIDLLKKIDKTNTELMAIKDEIKNLVNLEGGVIGSTTAGSYTLQTLTNQQKNLQDKHDHLTSLLPSSKEGSFTGNTSNLPSYPSPSSVAPSISGTTKTNAATASNPLTDTNNPIYKIMHGQISGGRRQGAIGSYGSTGSKGSLNQGSSDEGYTLSPEDQTAWNNLQNGGSITSDSSTAKKLDKLSPDQLSSMGIKKGNDGGYTSAGDDSSVTTRTYNPPTSFSPDIINKKIADEVGPLFGPMGK